MATSCVSAVVGGWCEILIGGEWDREARPRFPGRCDIDAVSGKLNRHEAARGLLAASDRDNRLALPVTRHEPFHLLVAADRPTDRRYNPMYAR
ncbi:MAG: hypothetical protein ACLQIB_32440 [Isosphaeraceae bacterium]